MNHELQRVLRRIAAGLGVLICAGAVTAIGLVFHGRGAAAQTASNQVLAQLCSVELTTNIPKTGSQYATLNCNSPGAIAVRRETNTGSQCDDSTVMNGVRTCDVPNFKVPLDTVISMENVLQQAAAGMPDLCCGNVGEPGTGRIDIVVYEQRVQGPKFDPRSSGRRPIVGGTTGAIVISNPDTMAHELGHAVIRGANGTLHKDRAADSVKNTPAGRASGAFNEGLADALASTWAAAKGSSPPDTGNPWVSGDGIFSVMNAPIRPGGPVLILQRDLRTPRKFADLNNNSTDPVEKLGNVYSYFFYRLSQLPGFQNPVDVMRVVLRTAKGATDAGNNGYDAVDFQAAVRAAVASSDPQKRAAVETVINEMSPSPAPLPPTTQRPAAPNGLRLTAALGCTFLNGVGSVSVWQMSWNPTPTAFDYELYTRGSGVLRFQSRIFGNVAELATNVPVEYTVNACNQAGCGPVSSEGVFVDNSLCDF